MKTSLFPTISIEEILEIEFKIAYNLKVKPDFNEKDWPEFVWLYERLAKQINEERNAESGQHSIQDIIQQTQQGRIVG